MRRSNLVLLAAIQLAGARSPGFNIHEDLLTYPQFEVVFSDDYISEKDANSLLEQSSQHPTYSADFAQSTLEQVREADERDNDEADEQTGPSHTYELMKLPPNQYLCSIPVIQPPAPENKTANELAKAEEARELSRATASGWDLVAQLENTCLYFMSGWWSYSFCNNREIVQFHALPSIPNGQPPKRDPHTTEFVLGRVPEIPANAAYQAKQKGEEAPPPAELQVKGDQRYLVQRLVGGTICDLTGRERTIEVQYHCVPTIKSDRIGWIKEVTICAYLMVVNTPRLCNDVAFLPPEETRANPIKCQLIVGEDETTPLLDQTAPLKNEPEAEAQKQDDATAQDQPPAKETVNVGGVIVGARNVLSGADEDGKPPAKLPPPRSYFSNTETDAERFIKVVASGKSKEDGGETEVLANDELERLELQAAAVKEMADRMKKLAGKHGWKLELVELPGGDKELRGYIDADEDELAKEKAQRKKEESEGKKASDGEDVKAEKKESEGQAEKKDSDEKGTEGSQEEFFQEG
ncbi:OS-9 [Fusarium albosuccineum]|uniref:Endoplasmic reticulum lectin n=1 Tax=Fusarium albosuccineum TaxID=1237068 RepID=A0A8H4PJY3_9HYPO|nr:OS-9 [Fusarium albosuccineum]